MLGMRGKTGRRDKRKKKEEAIDMAKQYRIRASDCPLGGDPRNDCEGCAYSGDYRYDPTSGECVVREEVPRNLSGLMKFGKTRARR